MHLRSTQLLKRFLVVNCLRMQFQRHVLLIQKSKEDKEDTGHSRQLIELRTYLASDTVCGSEEFLFWFRSLTLKEIRWGGAKHNPEDKDDGHRMHPRSSFNAFLEVVKRRSLPWENEEMDVIHSRQLIMRDSFKHAETSNPKAIVRAQLGEFELQGKDELSYVAREMVRLFGTSMAPIFVIDAEGRINGWNAKVAELSERFIGRRSNGEILGSRSCAPRITRHC